MSGLPRASWSNLLTTSPIVVMGLGSGTGVVPVQSIVNGGPSTITSGAIINAPYIANAGASRFEPLASINTAGDATNGATVLAVGAMIYNGATEDRLRSCNAGDGTTGAGVLGSAGMFYDTPASIYRRITSARNVGDGDGVNVPIAGLVYIYNGGGTAATAYDRLRNNAASNISQTTQPQAMAVAEPGEWTVTHAPGLAAQATASKGAGAAGVRHVARAFVVTYGGTVTGSILVNLRDGASGAGTVKWSMKLYTAANNCSVISISGLNIFGTAATAMTLETSAATAANTEASVSLSGYSTI